LSLKVAELSKTFTGDTEADHIDVLRNINFTIDDGQFISIIGPSGCGKTTLLRIIAGLENASSGKIFLDDVELTNPQEHIGFVFQEYALFPWRTTVENIEFGLEVKGVDPKTRRNAALEHIDIFGLSGFANKYPKELSGGMKQRVAIARTLITSPKVILMDEPFGSLDSQTRNSLQEFLLKIWQESKKTILFVTHNVDETTFLSDRIIALSKRPSRIIKIFEVDIPRPRDRTSAECNKLRKEVLDFLEKARANS